MSYENEDGKLIERLEDQNATMLYSYGFECGTSNLNEIDLENGVLKMHSAVIQLNTKGEAVGTPIPSRTAKVTLSVKECIERGIIDVAKLTEYYIEQVLNSQSPVEE
jgi:hypothetical protein